MPTEAELDVLIKVITSGQGNLAALDSQLSGMGGTSGSVSKFTNALQGQNAELVTAEQFTSNYGGQLTKTEAAYARSQLGALETSAATKGLSAEFNTAARAAGSMGLQSGEAANRLGALGSIAGGPAAGGLLALMAAFAGVYEVGKASLDNYEAQQKATLDLAQAYETQGKAVPTAKIQGFLTTNKQYIADQYQVEAAFAAATRAGFDYATTQRIVTDALDLTAAKGGDVLSNTTMLIDAENGHAMGLLSLGIAIKNVTDPQKDLADATKAATKADADKAKADRALQEELDHLHAKHKIIQPDLDHLADIKAKDLAATKNDTQAHKDLAIAMQEVADKGNKYNQVLDQVEAKVKGAHKDQTDLEGDQKKLNADWQNFSAKIGPGVETAYGGIIKAAGTYLEILDEVGTAIGIIENNPGKIGTALQTFFSDVFGGSPSRVPAGYGRGRQFGGQVYSGQSYLVGESGPELLTMGQGGSGNITPNNQLGGMIDMAETNMYLGQMVDLLALMVDQSSRGLGYSTLASVEYARSRGIAH